jgi:hypothetical protein
MNLSREKPAIFCGFLPQHSFIADAAGYLLCVEMFHQGECIFAAGFE